jgi:hypothetical protein
MPGHGGLVLCPGHAPVTTKNAGPPASDKSDIAISGMDMNVHGRPTGGAPHSPDNASAGICPFAAAASVMAPVHAAPAPLVSLLTSTITLFPPERTIPRGTIVPTYLPRGPPA